MTNQLTKAAIVVAVQAAFTVSTLQAAEITTDSQITAVTVYPGSAKVFRTSKVKLTPGKHDLVITNLPLNLIENSLRVAGESQGQVSLGSVQLQRNIKRDVVQQKEQQLRDKIEAVQLQRRATSDAIARGKLQLDYIKNMALGNTTKPANSATQETMGSYMNLPLDQWQQAWQTLDTATADVQEKIRQSENSLKETDKELNKLKRELRLVATNQKETRSAQLFVETDEATELNFNLSYQINGARWEPVYDADLDTGTGEIQLKTLAQISQRTGEDWKNVDVTLSTLRPSAGSQLPVLNPWPLDFMPELVPMVQAEADMYMGNAAESIVRPMAKAAPAPAPSIASKPRKRMVQQQSRLISTDFSAEYQVPGQITLDSGSDMRRFALTSDKLQAAVKLASAPRFDPRAMILATTKYTQPTPMIAGSMSLYRNGNFVGNTFISQKLSGEEIKLSFGEDDKVKIDYMPDPDKKRKDGILFGKKKVVERHYTVKVSNNHSKAYELSLMDVLPVSSNEEITVKSLGKLPSRKDIDDKEGVVSWDLKLQPKQTSKLNYGYSVSYPEDKTIPAL